MTAEEIWIATIDDDNENNILEWRFITLPADIEILMKQQFMELCPEYQDVLSIYSSDIGKTR